MKFHPKKAVLAAAALVLLGGCATSLEMGPGYYHYDTRIAGAAPVVTYTAPVAHKSPVVVHEPAVVRYGSATVY